MKLYKIRRKSDGLFSAGGYSPRWTKIGKVWRTLGPLKNHLQGGAAVAYDRLGDDVEIEMKEVGTLDFRDIMRGVREARAEREQRQRETHERVMREHKEAQLAQLKRELGHD